MAKRIIAVAGATGIPNYMDNELTAQEIKAGPS